MLHRARDARKVSVCAADEKFRDISTILPRPGHSRDKAQPTGTVPAIPGRLETMHVSSSAIYPWHDSRAKNPSNKSLPIMIS